MEAFNLFNSDITASSIGIFILWIFLFGLACYFEVRFSKKEEWWKGLILPAILLVFGLPMGPLHIILLTIYFMNRHIAIKYKKEEIEQMKIQDL